ncbi:hypothetical protein ES708_25221 [subsurface metagenome]
MTLDKAIEYLEYILKQHPRLEHGDFGQAVKLGRQSAKRIQNARDIGYSVPADLLPGEDPE